MSLSWVCSQCICFVLLLNISNKTGAAFFPNFKHFVILVQARLFLFSVYITSFAYVTLAWLFDSVIKFNIFLP